MFVMIALQSAKQNLVYKKRQCVGIGNYLLEKIRVTYYKPIGKNFYCPFPYVRIFYRHNCILHNI